MASIRAESPWRDDPYDLIASFVAVFLPGVIAVTWLRSLANRGPAEIPQRSLILIQRGVAAALGGVVGVCAADWASISASPTPRSTRLLLLLVLLTLTSLATLTGVTALIRSRLMRCGTLAISDAKPSDSLDDLAVLIALFAPASFATGLAGSAHVLRRHRRAAVALPSLATLCAAPLWHAWREGAWANTASPLIFGTGLAVFVGLTLLFLIGPLQALRP
ncbi:MAG: hypothetical protein ACJ752_04245 [Gaiellaceae bacterium]